MGFLLGGDTDVTLISPAGRPGVSDNEVVDSTGGSVTNSGDGVIELGSTSGGVKDTRSISLEDRLVGLNGDGGWSLSNGGSKIGSGVLRNLMDFRDVHLWCSTLLAGTVLGGVSVITFENLTVLGNVVHAISLPSSIASSTLGIAIDELLFGEGDQSSGLDLVVSFDGTGGGEGPA